MAVKINYGDVPIESITATCVLSGGDEILIEPGCVDDDHPDAICFSVTMAEDSPYDPDHGVGEVVLALEEAEVLHEQLGLLIAQQKARYRAESED